MKNDKMFAGALEIDQKQARESGKRKREAKTGEPAVCSRGWRRRNFHIKWKKS